MTDYDGPIEQIRRLGLQPGDTLVVAVNRADSVRLIQAQLDDLIQAWYPGCHVLVLPPGTQTSVIPAKSDEPPVETDQLDPEVAAELRARFDQGDACKHCGGLHSRSCPRVRRMAFHTSGQLAEVEFWAHGDWSDDHVIFPEELPDTDSA